ncbi:MAG: DJ-1/PfpI family protein [Candidatus Parcubacteria bacterium]|nr:DJ-1/PfpI family protein [Candidatus Parcubacteria bacterium]
MPSKIIIVVAKKSFKDEEYFVTKEIFEGTGFIVTTTASEKGVAEGVDGGEANIDVTLENIDLESAIALVLIGGGGAQTYLENEAIHNLIKKAYQSGKIIGAICIAPAILAKAGILNGKKATVWTSSLDKKFAKMIEVEGAQYLSQDVVEDGNIITANGPEATESFARALVAKLKEYNFKG